jgi:hypothetical protein
MKFVLSRLIDLVSEIGTTVKYAVEDIVEHVKTPSSDWEDDFVANQFAAEEFPAEEAPKKKKKGKKKSKK